LRLDDDLWQGSRIPHRPPGAEGASVGIHLISPPSARRPPVVTGLIKANMPSKSPSASPRKWTLEFVLDQNGAETCSGQGDMLFLPPGREQAEPRAGHLY
jgi:DNA segregation ATPase FtsK/SpoIIIE-like protein